MTSNYILNTILWALLFGIYLLGLTFHISMSMFEKKKNMSNSFLLSTIIDPSITVLFDSSFLLLVGLICLVLAFVIGIILMMPMPGVKCPRCLERGVEQWVLPGKHCPRCNCPC